MYKEAVNVKMAKRNTTNHMGTTVFLRYPIPKGRNDPSVLYTRVGLNR